MAFSFSHICKLHVPTKTWAESSSAHNHWVAWRLIPSHL